METSTQQSSECRTETNNLEPVHMTATATGIGCGPTMKMLSIPASLVQSRKEAYQCSGLGRHPFIDAKDAVSGIGRLCVEFKDIFGNTTHSTFVASYRGVYEAMLEVQAQRSSLWSSWRIYRKPFDVSGDTFYSHMETENWPEPLWLPEHTSCGA